MNGNWADMLNLYYYGSEDAIRAYKSQKIRIAFSLTGDGKDLDGTLKW